MSTFGGAPLLHASTIADDTIVGTIPPNAAGYVDVEVLDGNLIDKLVSYFLYFDPSSQFGGVWGEAIINAVNVTVIDGSNNGRIAGASVVGVSFDDSLAATGLTDENGQITLSNDQIRAPMNITAAAEGFEANTVEDITAENVTVILIPQSMGNGNPPAITPADKWRRSPA